jgi:hypothetical protein
VEHLFRGEFIAAFEMNPMVCVAFCIGAALFVYGCGVLWLGWKPVELPDPTTPRGKLLRAIAALLLISNWLWLVYDRR